MTQARELPQCIKATMQMESNMHERIHADGVRMHRTGVLLNVKPAQVDLLFVVPDVRLPALGPPACNLRACSSHACKHREGTQCHPADGIFSCVHGHVGKTATHNRPQIHARADLGMCWDVSMHMACMSALRIAGLMPACMQRMQTPVPRDAAVLGACAAGAALARRRGAAPLGTVPNVGGVLNALLHAPGGALLLLLLRCARLLLAQALP